MKSKLLVLLLGCVSFAALPADLKIATLDLQRVVADYHQAQAVTRQLKEKEVSFVKELEGLRLEGNHLLAEAEDLRKLSLDVALNETVREQKKKGFELKLMDVRALEVRLQEVKSKRESELQAQFAQASKSIFDEVMSVTRSIGEQDGFNLILNRNQANPTASGVLFANHVEDVTARVLAQLNAGATTPKTVEPTPAKETTK